MRAVTDHDELAALCAGDPAVLWTAQGLGPPAGAWRSDDGAAVVAAHPDLGRRARMAVHGPAGAAAALVDELAGPRLHPAYRLLGRSALVHDVVARSPQLAVRSTFGWMTRRGGTRPAPGPAAGWLGPEHTREIADLIDDDFPDSLARPDRPGAERWAGVRGPDGRLAAVAANAWSAPGVGLIAGVVARRSARGTGAARAAFRLALDAALDRGTAALMVDADNAPAVALYRAHGFDHRPVTVAWAPPDDPGEVRPSGADTSLAVNALAEVAEVVDGGAVP